MGENKVKRIAIKVLIGFCILLGLLIAGAVFVVITYFNGRNIRPENVLEYDGAYYWNEKQCPLGEWTYVETPSGWNYYLYIPKDVDYEKDLASVPLVVVFHGQSGKYTSVSRHGRVFKNKEFQEKSGGCAVLVLMSRIDYFTDPHSAARLIRNVIIKYPCLDKERVVTFGFSQGAMFVVNLAVAEPSLCKAVISGSGFYDITFSELMKVRHVQFFTGTSENDMGIFEHAMPTGKALAFWCKNSRYIQYKTRGHFALELDDPSGIGDETLEDWLLEIIKK